MENLFLLDTGDSFAEEHLANLNECLDSLKPEHQHLIHQKYQFRMSCEEISRLNQKSLSWAKMSLVRIRQTLKSCLNRMNAELSS